jgi:hypothetical protein
MGDEFGADSAAGAAPVLDHHRLVERLADSIARYAPDNIGITAGGERHDQMYRPFRIGGQSPPHQQRQNGCRSERGEEYAAWNGHHGSPCCRSLLLVSFLNRLTH